MECKVYKVILTFNVMVEVIDRVDDFFIGLYDGFRVSLSPGQGLILQVFSLAILLTIVSLFIWKFYKSISKRNLIELNLSKYNRFSHPVLSKMLAGFLFLIENILVMPILITLWFAGLSIVLLLIAEERSVQGILLISAVFITTIRILAYHRAEISKDLAKIFPFIALSIFLLSPGAFDVPAILGKFKEIPLLLVNIVYFLIIIFAVEIVLSIFYAVYDFFRSEEVRI